MDVEPLIQALSAARAYAHETGSIEIRQTHISVVFLAGEYAYKIKKPVDLGFLDFTTLDRRHRACDDELRLNRRLAEHVYLDVVPIVQVPDGLAVERSGEPVEWAVKMRRLPDAASLLASLETGQLTTAVLERVAARLADFHRNAERRAEISEVGRFDVVAQNVHENFEQTVSDVGSTVSPAVFARLRDHSERCLAALRPLLEARAERGVPCDGHGDLRLEHIYAFAEREPPADLVIIDCVEFSERFRFGDPVADVAFTVMELFFHDRADLARSFADAYFRFADDEEGRALLAFYVAYRSVVRAKVRGFELREREIPEERRQRSRARAKAHFLLALSMLESPRLRPALVLVGGLPGTGKSTLARGLGDRAGFEVIRSDIVRKELAGLSPDARASSRWGDGIYSHDWTLRTYAECLSRVETLLFEGRRVIVDASFASAALRDVFLHAARSRCVPLVWFVCQASPEQVRQRLGARSGDASDADWAIYESACRQWEPAAPTSELSPVPIDTDGGAAAALARALDVLCARELWTAGGRAE
ncbi:MAG TPA: AAA family ATPase [Polyangiaceae bacterium]